MRLGRAYPAPLEERIRKTGSRIDQISSQSVLASLERGSDVSLSASTLNTRLANEVIIVSAQVTDEEASARLDQVEKALDGLGSAEVKAKLLRTPQAVVFSPQQAESFVAQWDRALLVYRDAAERISRFKAASQDYDDLVAELVVLDRDAVWNEGAVTAFEELSEDGSTVEMDPATFQRIVSWIGQALSFDNRERRMEAVSERRPARPIPAASRVSPWMSIAAVTAGLGGVGMVFWYAIKE